MQAKGDIREILIDLPRKHGATVRDVTVARIWIRPVPFAAWCKGRNVSPDQAARFLRKRGRATSAFPALTYNG